MVVLIMDNGASTLKAGLSSDQGTPPRIVQNAAMRSKGDKTLYVGHEIDNCRDHSSVSFRLPFERGYLTDWDVEKAVWDGVFTDDVLSVDPSGMSLLVTEPYFNLPNIQETYDQLIFEEYVFESYYRCTPAAAAAYSAPFAVQGHPPECMIILDSGYSFTHAVPLINGSVVWASVRRLDVGGKLLTNHLKELVSFRQWNMMDQTTVMNDVKEQCCYVSASYFADLETCRSHPRKNPIVQQYVLPDLTEQARGHVRKPDDMDGASDQVLYMNNERFTVPEVLFNPSDIGLEQAGVAESVANAIASLPSDLQGLFWANIGLVGGTTLLPGFQDRLWTELRALAPAEFEVHIYDHTKPIELPYTGAMYIARHGFNKRAVTRAEYEESGSTACRRKFRATGPPESSFVAETALQALLDSTSANRPIPAKPTARDARPSQNVPSTNPTTSLNTSTSGGRPLRSRVAKE